MLTLVHGDAALGSRSIKESVATQASSSSLMVESSYYKKKLETIEKMLAV